MTAYLVAGMAQARSAGVQVKNNSMARGVSWLKRDLKTDRESGDELRAYLGFALGLSGNVDTSLLNQLYTRRSGLSPYGSALLGLALEQAKDNRAARKIGGTKWLGSVVACQPGSTARF